LRFKNIKKAKIKEAARKKTERQILPFRIFLPI